MLVRDAVSRRGALPRWCISPGVDLLADRYNDRDIEVIIRERVKIIARQKKFKQDASNAIIEKILSNTSGCLLWADIVLTKIQKDSSTNLRKLEKLVDDMPRNLTKAYFKMLGDIQKEQLEDAVRVLQIIVGTKRPLTLQEMQHALATSPECKTFEDVTKSVEEDIEEYLHRILGCIVRAVEGRIHLMHHSLRAFITKLTPENSEWKTGEFTEFETLRKICNFSEERYSQTLSEICMQYLRFCGHADSVHHDEKLGDVFAFSDELFDESDATIDGPLPTKNSGPIEEDSSDTIFYFRDYASYYWPEHFRSCSTNKQGYEKDVSSPTNLTICAVELYPSSVSTMMHWIHQSPMNYSKIDLTPMRKAWSPLVASSFFGHLGVLLYLRANTAAKNHKEYLNLAGVAASYVGNTKCIKTLIDIDTELAQDTSESEQASTRINYGRMLELAVANGYTGVIEFFIQRGADVTAGSTFNTPLAVAAYCFQPKAVELLFKYYDASKSPFGPIFCAMWRPRSLMTPEQADAQRKIFNIFLSNRNIDWSQRDDNGRTVFSYAAENGTHEFLDWSWKTVPRSVLDDWLNDKGDRINCTPVWYAAFWGRGEFIKKAAEVGDISFQISVKGKEGANAYACATRQGHVNVIRLLVKLDGARAADDPNYSLQTPLTYAVMHDNGDEAARLLLNTGRVNVDSISETNETPLGYAITYNNMKVARVLLEASADITKALKQDKDGTLSYIQGQNPLSNMEELGRLWNRYRRE